MLEHDKDGKKNEEQTKLRRSKIKKNDQKKRMKKVSQKGKLCSIKDCK